MRMFKTFAALLIAVAALCPLAAFPQAYNPSTNWTSSDIAAIAAAAAPVQSVNSNTGNVAVPTYVRQVSSALAITTTDGTLTWTFPTSFTNQPTCFTQLAASATTHSFDAPLITAISQNSVSYQVTSHSKTLSILALGTLTLTLSTVPVGTTMTISCLAPQ